MFRTRVHSRTPLSLSLSAGEMIVSSGKHRVEETTRNQYETRMTLRVRHFERSDVGSYRCIAKNSLGEVDSNIRLYGKWRRRRRGGGTLTESLAPTEIPGTQRKNSLLETNEVLRGRAHNYPVTPHQSLSPLPASSSSVVAEDSYRTSEELEEEEEDGDEDGRVSITNPTRSTLGGGTRHVSLVGLGRHPPEFVDSELVPHSHSPVICCPSDSVAVLVLCWTAWISWDRLRQ